MVLEVMPLPPQPKQEAAGAGGPEIPDDLRCRQCSNIEGEGPKFNDPTYSEISDVWRASCSNQRSGHWIWWLCDPNGKHAWVESGNFMGDPLRDLIVIGLHELM